MWSIKPQMYFYTLLKRFYFPELGGVGQEAFEFTSNFGNNRVDSDMYKCTYYKPATTLHYIYHFINQDNV